MRGSGLFRFRHFSGMGGHHTLFHHTQQSPTIPDNIDNQYKIINKIGEGSFGVIYNGVNILTDQPIAAKFERRHADVLQLQEEYRIYKHLEGAEGLPSIYYFGHEGDFNVLVMDLLGPSLEELFELCDRQFTPKTVAIIGKQMLRLLQGIHGKGWLYRDVKPDNFLIGRPRTPGEKQLYLIDFGMAKPYIDPKTGKHIIYRERGCLSGTARYMSINTHQGKEQSRRDDLESLAYVLLYFLRGALPWQGVKAANSKQKYEKIGEIKRTTSVEKLCAGFPMEFAIFLHYARKLRFDDTPDYEFCMQTFDRALKRINEVDDGVCDWMTMNDGKGWEATERKEKPKPLMLEY
ncbi:kinase-like domain-containing protein [Syncephalastrum racemosum]|uniref:Kinase-like domain-containing protein n=1 Tax=Syncephalastrum racemosum TaxID=13706 RepID=A0A1X2HLK0_SYNRA|nr:kinase-like domain-containing protein [Syncephalastrum racemosum]